MGGVLDSRFTFTRSTTATYINSSGYVATMAAAATNDPTKARFDYDPTTLAPKGLLIEGSAINVLPASQNLSNASYWTIQTAYTSVSTTETSPSNVGNANLFTEPNIANPRSIYQNFALTAGTYTASIFVKYNTGTVRGLRVVLSSASNNFGYVTINMSTGAVIQSGASVGTASNTSATVTAYPNSWYRITLTTTVAATCNFIFLIPVSISGIGTPSSDYGRESYTGNSSTFSLWGAQVESGTGASSYIPTTTAQVARAEDVCNIGTITAFNYSTTNGTLFYSGVITKQNAGGYPIRLGFYKLSGDERCFSFYTNANSLFFGAAGNATAETSKSYTLNTAFKAAMSLDASLATNEVIVNINGTTGSTGATALTATNAPTQFSFGQTGYGAYFPCGTIAAVKYWPLTKTAAELAVLTA